MLATYNHPAKVKLSQGFIGRIPVRNIWLLMFYASRLFEAGGLKHVAMEDRPDYLPDMIAELMVSLVERRLRQNLSFHYRNKRKDLYRLRGKIDFVTTNRRQLLARGKLHCSFDTLTIDTKRNRYIYAALEQLSRLVQCEDLGQKCRMLALRLRQMGVTPKKPTRAEISQEAFGRHDKEDKPIFYAAHLVFNLALPTEEVGRAQLPNPNREEKWLRRLFELAIGGFYRVVLDKERWSVYTGRYLQWPISEQTEGMREIFPSMQTDIIIDDNLRNQRTIIDTKFTEVIKAGYYRDYTLESGHIYQIYAYLRSQATGDNPLADNAQGLLLYPSLGKELDETTTIQGHRIRFATVDLSLASREIRERLLYLIN